MPTDEKSMEDYLKIKDGILKINSTFDPIYYLRGIREYFK